MKYIDTRKRENLTTLIEVLQFQALTNPDLLAFEYLSSDSLQPVQQVNYRQLLTKVEKATALLLAQHCPGERVILLFDSSIDFVVAFLACLAAKMVAVPLYPPRKDEKFTRIYKILQDCQPKIILGSQRYILILQRHIMQSQYQHIRCLAYEIIEEFPCFPTENIKRSREDLALLQYTSGSTGDPKGVMVTHHNLMVNQLAISESFRTRVGDRCLTWLPMQHDMGLIGTVLHPLYAGISCYILSPLVFIQDPLSWLHWISELKITLSGAPNFAYSLCTRHAQEQPERVNKFDLSLWRIAFNGAEPIHEQTLVQFSQVFAESKFKEQQFFPCYGLAEATLLVSAQEQTSMTKIQVNKAALSEQHIEIDASVEAKVLVSCGLPNRSVEVRIVDNHRRILPEGHVGEIWIKGASVCQGYWQQKHRNRIYFEQNLPQAGKDFFRTGDLGVFWQKHLYVTGRIKDLIIHHGKNYYPLDIEQCTEEVHEAIRDGCSVAFKSNDSEQIILIAELEQEKLQGCMVSDLFHQIKQQLVVNIGISIDKIIFTAPGNIQKTTSGKVRRKATEEQWQGQILPIIAQTKIAFNDLSVTQRIRTTLFDLTLLRHLPPVTAVAVIEIGIRQAVADEVDLPLEQVDSSQSIQSYGIHSMILLNIIHRLELSLQIRLNNITDFYAGESIDQLANQICLLFETKPQPLINLQQHIQFEIDLAPNQQQIWFLQQLDPNRVDYHLVLALKSHQAIQYDQLSEALIALTQRHEILRTIYVEAHGEVKQLIQFTPNIDLLAQNLTREEKNRWFLEQSHLPFNLAKDPVLRVRMAIVDDDYYLLWVIHHIASDLWSCLLLLEEAMYLVSGQSLVESLPTQYRHYSQQQLDYSLSADYEEDKLFWHQQLHYTASFGVIPEQSNVKHQAGVDRQDFIIDSDLTRLIHNFIRFHQISINTLLMAALQWMLHDYSHESAVTIGTLTTGRSDSRFSQTQGYFVNPMAITSFKEAQQLEVDFIKECDHRLRQCLAHQQFPFAAAINDFAHKEAITEQEAFFVIVFVFQQSYANQTPPSIAIQGVETTIEQAGLTWEVEALNFLEFPFPIRMMIAESQDQLIGNLHYKLQWLKPETAKNWIDSYLEILQQWMHNFQLGLGLAQRELMMRPQTAIQKGKTIVGAFEIQSRLTPEHPALTYEDQQINYQQLNQQANQIAHLLRFQFQLSSDRPIAIILERRPRMIATLLAILKLGKPYLPIDPYTPSLRVIYILEEAEPDLVIIDHELVHHFQPVIAGHHFTWIDWQHIAQQQANYRRENLSPIIAHEQSCAYILFTSGSTGQPKGVRVSHHNVLRLFHQCHTYFNFSNQDKWSLFHSCAFDVSVWEIFGALLHGGELVIVPYEISRDPGAFYQLLKRNEITILNQTPSAFRYLSQIDETYPSKLSHLRTVVFAGEKLIFGQLKSWLRKYGEEQPVVYNMYGITEVTVHASIKRVKENDIRAGLSNIGRPLNDLQFLILNDELEPVNEGDKGELYVSGGGVSIGYLNQPELTAERFLSLKLPGKAQPQTLYRSGDLVRALGNNEFEYLDRLDNQVNLRGFRIELAEIESALLQIPGIEQAVVLVYAPALLPAFIQTQSDLPTLNKQKYLFRHAPEATLIQDEGQLYAFIMGDSSIVVNELYHDLSQIVPDHMLPRRIIHVESYPLTANGKVNKSLLITYLEQSPIQSANFIPANNEVEQQIVQSFQQVLSINKVGRQDAFFFLGGNSIQILELKNLLNSQGFEFTIPDIFRKQTPEKLAELHFHRGHSNPTNLSINQAYKIRPFSLISGGQTIAEQVIDAYPLSHFQQLWIQAIPWSVNKDHLVNIIQIRLRIPFDLGRLEQAYQTVVSEQEVLRTGVFFENAKKIVQWVFKSILVKVKVFDLTNKPTIEQQQDFNYWLQQERQIAFDWLQPPLMRLTVFLWEDKEWSLLVSYHSMLLDSWSEITLMTDLLRYYTEQSVTPPGQYVIRFANYLAKEKQALQSNKARHYWQVLLKEATFTRLPKTFLKQEKKSIIEQTNVNLGIQFPVELSTSIKFLAKRLNLPIQSILLAAHCRAVSFLSNQTTVCVAVEQRGYLEYLNGYQVLGNHLNLLPLVVQFSANETWQQLIEKVDQQMNASLEHQYFPLQQLLSYLSQPQQLPDLSFQYTHWQNYTDLANVPNLVVLEASTQSVQPYLLRIDFGQDPFTEFLFLDLQAQANYISQPQLREISDLYIKILKEINIGIDQQYTNISLLSVEQIRWQTGFLNKKIGSELQFIDFVTHFDQLSTEQPDHTVIYQKNYMMSYQQLYHRSLELAESLDYEGVQFGEQVLVAINASSIDYIATIIALWRLGAIVVVYNAEVVWKEYCEQITHCIVDDKTSLSNIEIKHHIFFKRLTRVAETLFNNHKLQPQHIALRIVTKKGIVDVKHLSLIYQSKTLIKRIGLNNSDCVLYQGDLLALQSIWQLCTPLMVGASLLLPEHNKLSSMELFQLLASYPISVLQVNRQLLQQVVQQMITLETQTAIKPERFSLRTVISKDTLLDSELLALCQQRIEKVQFINLWGDHEHIGFCTTHRVTANTSTTEKIIGTPIIGCQIQIVDSWLQTVAVGVPGEIIVQGSVLNGIETTIGYTNIASNMQHRMGVTGYLAESGELYLLTTE